MSSLLLLFPVCPLSPFPTPAAFHAQAPSPPHSAHLFPTSLPCPYNMVFAVCPALKVPETEAGKLCTFHRPTPATRRIYPFITTLVSQSVLPCLKSPFGNGVLFIIRRDVWVLLNLVGRVPLSPTPALLNTALYTRNFPAWHGAEQLWTT